MRCLNPFRMPQGFGKMATYHANNEYCLLSDFAKGFRVLCRLIDRFNA